MAPPPWNAHPLRDEAAAPQRMRDQHHQRVADERAMYHAQRAAASAGVVAQDYVRFKRHCTTHARTWPHTPQPSL